MATFLILHNYAFKAGVQAAQRLKYQMNTDSAPKGEKGGLPKAIILYNYESNKPKQLMGYIIRHSPIGFAIYVEGKVNFIPMSRIIQISYPVK